MSIPCCYFPTTVTFIDDNKKFLENLSLAFSRADLQLYQFFDNPLCALEFINKTATESLFINKYILELEQAVYGQGMININIPRLHEEIFNKNRFNAPSVVVVDQVMPQMEGLEVCRKISHPSIKKIMLTGEADEQLAIKAFNEGIIHHFIRKNSEHLEEEIKHAIATLQRQYFQEQYNLALNSLTCHTEKQCALNDPAFIDFFEGLCESNFIKEYYLLDSSGSFLLIDQHQKTRWLIVKTNEELDHLASFAEEEEAPRNVYEPLKNRTRLIYFYSDADSLTSPAEWGSFIYPIEGRLEGRHSYYYALLDHPQASAFEAPRVAFLSDYRVSQEA